MLSESISPPSAGHENSSKFDVIVIGSGFGGLGTAIKLQEAGIRSFVVLERGTDVGGTWRDNDYPGCACDVQSHLYSFSFEPNPGWSRLFAPQREIFSYLRRCADKYDVRKYVRFGESVVRADYDDARAEWTVRTSSGSVFRGKALISAMGALSNPAFPDLPGLEQFEGRAFHSALWDHDFDLTGKRVAVIGTGASAIQFVPKIAPVVGHLDVYQRTPPWVLPKPDRATTERERKLFRLFPLLQWLYRAFIYWMLEARVLAFFRPGLMKQAEVMGRRHIEKQIPDPELCRKVTPDYTMGCKRILMSDDYYPALARKNVSVLTDSVREVRRRSIVTADGVEREVDAIIFGTGFTVQSLVPRGMFIGSKGQDITAAWSNGLAAYKGTTVAGFPNFFFIAGPNTGLGHTSMVFMIESQIAYVVDALRHMRDEGWASVDVRLDVQDTFNDVLQEKHTRAVWSSGCRSWYLDARGRNTTLWPGFTFVFRRLTSRFDPSSYVIMKARAELLAPSLGRAPGTAESTT
ncbi:MAG TPA: NAD(P)/FAD-dependent oxidoreductase [Polyangiaceae bacterium]|jgi:cation diffusion facilitator CzcD-associated flavoprotein CzcO|nr:NAD(P)/FAD-dependent oxidoreductase [Polyangiaceae bacterium]